MTGRRRIIVGLIAWVAFAAVWDYAHLPSIAPGKINQERNDCWVEFAVMDERFPANLALLRTARWMKDPPRNARRDTDAERTYRIACHEPRFAGPF